VGELVQPTIGAALGALEEEGALEVDGAELMVGYSGGTIGALVGGLVSCVKVDPLTLPGRPTVPK